MGTSHVCDLVKGKAARAGEWAHFIRTTHHWVTLREPTGRGKLNKAEIEKLQEVTERYQDDSEWDICGKRLTTRSHPRQLNHAGKMAENR